MFKLCKAQFLWSCIHLLVALPVRGALFLAPQDLPQKQYDFVVVGAGAAGNVIANRLTENPKFSVLVIEAGVTNDGVLSSIVPFLAPSIQPQSAITWNFTTVPQRGLNDRVLSYSRGRILGGSSSINFLTFTRGSNDEYDRLAKITEDEDWSWKKLAPYFLKSERFAPPSDHHNTAGQADPKVHGHGPVQISVPSFGAPLDSLVVNTSKKLGGEFSFNLDMQSGNSVGFSFAQSAVDSAGKRSSSATAYLDPIMARKNLDVLIQTQVTRLLTTGSTRRGPSFNKVEFAQSASSKRFTVTAKKEVILSAGSLNTPQVLLLSGIGDRNALSKHGIQTKIHLPDVGQHLQDHPILSNYYLVNSNSTWDQVLRDPTIAGALLTQWNATGQGLFSDPPANTLGFVRLPRDSSIFKKFPDPSAGVKSGHVEMLFANGFAATVSPQPPGGNFVTVNTAVVTPLSRGSVTLNSTDPFAFPNIDPAFFTSPFDRFAMVQVVKAVRKFVQGSPFKGFIISPSGAMGKAQTDSEIEEAAKDAIVTIWHPTSTARMSPKNANWGVVDSDLLVKGASGLRIVDASVLPIIPAAHTTGPVYIIAERAADLIKATWT